MGHFRNVATGVVVRVDDSKDARFAGEAWEPADAPAKPPAKKATPGKPDK